MSSNDDAFGGFKALLTKLPENPTGATTVFEFLICALREFWMVEGNYDLAIEADSPFVHAHILTDALEDNGFKDYDAVDNAIFDAIDHIEEFSKVCIDVKQKTV